MRFETILLNKADDVAVITLNRPERLNAWTDRMSAELQAAISACNDDPDVGAMVVTGAGRGFCAGADIRDSFKARMTGPAQAGTQARQEAPRDWNRLGALVKTADRGRERRVRRCGGDDDPADGRDRGLRGRQVRHDVREDGRYAGTLQLALSGSTHGSWAGQRDVLDGAVVQRPAKPTRWAWRIGWWRRTSSWPKPARWPRRSPRTRPGTCAGSRNCSPRNGSESDIAKVREREGKVLAKAYASAEHQEAVDAFLAKRKPVFPRDRE